MTKEKSTEVATIDATRLEALRDASGANAKGGAVWPIKLKVNRQPLAEDDSPLPMGKYVMTIDKIDHYMTEVDMIIMEKGNQFIRFSKQGYVGCTMIENTFNPEYKDTLGTTRMGRVVGQAYEDMSDAQKEAKFTFHMLGVADVSQAVDSKGKRIYKGSEAKFVPTSIQFKGKKSVEKQNEFKKLKKKDEAYFEFITRLGKPFKDGDVGGTPFYDYVLSRGDAVPLTTELLDSIEAIKSLIENENKRIYGLHLKAQQEIGEGDIEEGSYTDLDIKE